MSTVFNTKKFDATKQPMFFGESVNVSRYDVQRYPIFEKLIEKQLGFFWLPQEIDLSKDRKDFQDLSEAEKHIFLSNLKYQTLLDSVQGRSPNLALLPIVSLPEVETHIETWSFYETIHSRSYTHIIRSIMPDPSEVFDSIMDNPEILKRAGSVTRHYDNLISYTSRIEAEGLPKGDYTHKKLLLLCLTAVSVLEGIRFFVSFACTFSFAEQGKMEGVAKIVKLICRDEMLHLVGCQEMLKACLREDEEYASIYEECEDEFKAIYEEAAAEESEWCDYLFSHGAVLGLSSDILKTYVKFITNEKSKAVGLGRVFDEEFSNPLPWMDDWVASDNLQVAPQETAISSYLTAAVDSDIGNGAFTGFDL